MYTNFENFNLRVISVQRSDQVEKIRFQYADYRVYEAKRIATDYSVYTYGACYE